MPESSEKTEEPESTDTNSEAESGEASGSDEAEKNLWKLVTALKSAGKPDTEQAGDQVLSIRAVSIAGTEISIVFSEYSAESYQAAVNGGAPLLVPADDIDSLVCSIHAMQ